MNKTENTQRRQGIYLLPNIFTTAALLCGFYSIVLAFSGRYIESAIAVVIAAVLDGLDGRVARMTKTSTPFGAEYDSMADMVSFGIAPAVLAYSWGLTNWNENTWLIAFFFVAGTALRLARFSSQVSDSNLRGFFQGMPSPAAAGTLVSFVWACENLQWHDPIMRWPLFLLCLVLAVLMVSNVRFYSFKDFSGSKIPFIALFGVVVATMILASHTSLMLFIVGMIYLSSGPVLTLIQLRNKRLERRLRLNA